MIAHMYWFIAIVIVVLLGMTYIGWVYFQTALELILNIPLLYIVYLRFQLHVLKQNKGMEYAMGLIISGLIFVMTYGLFVQLPFWPITSFIFLAYLIAELLIYHEIKHKIVDVMKRREVREGTLRKIRLKQASNPGLRSAINKNKGRRWKLFLRK